MSQRQQLQLLGTGHFKQFNLPNQTTTQNQALNSLKSQFQPLLNHKNNNKKIWLGGINAARKHSKTLNAFKAQQSTHKVKDESPIRKQKRVKEKKQKLKQAAKYQQTRIQNIREQNKLNSEKKEDLLKCQDISRMFSHSQKKNKFVNKYYDPESLNWEKQIIQKKVLKTQQSPLKPLIKNAANPINYCKAVSQSSRKIKTQESEKKKSVNRQSLQNPKKHTRSRAFSSINGAAKNTLAPQGNARLCKQNSLEFTFGK